MAGCWVGVGDARAHDPSVTASTIDAAFWRYDHAARASPASRASIDRSERARQAIGNVSLARLGKRRARLRVSVAYPRIGRRGATGWLRVTVWNAAARQEPVALYGKRIRARRGRTVDARVVLDGRGGRRLSRALRKHPRRALRMVTINSFHGRNLDSDRAIEHAVVTTRVARRARRAPQPRRGRATAQVGGTKADVEVMNSASDAVTITSAPVSCMYDNGESGSELTSFNGAFLAPGASATYQVQNDENTGSSPGADYSWDGSDTPPATGKNVTISPGYIDTQLYSPEVAGLLYNLVSYYEQLNPGDTADTYIPTAFTEAYAIRSHRFNDCWTGTSLFAIGADAYPSGQTRTPTVGHTAAVFELEGENDVAERASLDSTLIEQMSNYGGATGLAISGGSEIEIVDQGGSGCSSQAGPDWMQCVFPPGSAEEQTALYDIVFPGSHDSGTPNLASSPDWILDLPTPVPPSDVCSHYSTVFDYAPTLVYRAASTQSLIIRQQLDLGIRYLDLRVAYDAGTGDDPGGMWRILHSMVTQSSLQTELEYITNWLAGHPDEVVVLDFNHVCPQAAPDGETSALIDTMTTTGPSGKSLCDVAYVATGAAEDLPSNTLAQVRRSGRNAIVLLDGNSEYDIPSGCGLYPFYDQTANNPSGKSGNVQVNHLWPDTPGPGIDACLSFDPKPNKPYAELIEGYPTNSGSPDIGNAPILQDYKNADPVPFTQTQTQYTPSTSAEIEALILCDNLPGYEANMIEAYRPGILSGWGDLANFVIGDMVSFAYVNQLISFNQLAPSAAATPDPVSFGRVGVAKRRDETVTVTNTGSGFLHVGQVTTSGAPFTVGDDGCSHRSVAPNGGSCTLRVSFAPAAEQAYQGELSFATNVPGQATQTVALSGTGVEPGFAVTPDPVDFGNVWVNERRTETVTVSNPGNGELDLGQIASSGTPFTISDDACSNTSVAPAATCTLRVTFAPTAAQAYQGELSFATNVPGQATQTVALPGTGVEPGFAVVPDPVDFGNVWVNESRTETVTVSNPGNGELRVGQIASSGAPFTVADDQCSNTTVAPNGGTCTLQVSFAPTTEQDYQGQLSFPFNSPDIHPKTLQLAGTGVEPGFAVAPDPVDFGNVWVNETWTETVTVANTGNGRLDIGQVTTSGSRFTIENDRCSNTTVAPNGGTCALDVVFAPTAAQDYQGELRFPTNVPDQPTQTVAMSGTGVEPGFALSPDPVAFGEVAVGAERTERLTVTNTGNGVLNVGQIASSGAPFTITDDECSNTGVAPAATCTLRVVFAPTAAADDRGRLRFPFNSPDIQAKTVELAGTGIEPGFRAGPAVLALGNVELGQTATGSVSVTNSGRQALRIGVVAVSGPDFSLAGGDCAGATIDPGRTCTAAVAFRPQLAGPAQGELLFATNIPGRAGQAVALSGAGVSPPIPSAELAIANQVNHRKSTVGRPLTYTLAVTNRGPSTATGVQVTDTLSLPGKLVSATSTAGSCTTALPLSCSLGSIRSGDAVTITIVVIPKDAGTARNTATVTAQGVDPQTANNSDAVSASIAKRALRMVMRADHASVDAGQAIRYTIKVTNPTGLAFRRVRTCTNLPSGLVYVGSRGRATLSRGRYCWRTGRLGAHKSKTYKLTVRAVSGASGIKVNRARVTSPGARTTRAERAVRVRAGEVRNGGVTG